MIVHKLEATVQERWIIHSIPFCKVTQLNAKYASLIQM